MAKVVKHLYNQDGEYLGWQFEEVIEEAPQDTKEYVRKDGEWIEATSGGGVTSYNDLTDKPAIPTLADIYPIGCIYTEITGVNPNTTFGFGTWVAFGSGKVLIGLDSGDTDFDTAEETGGAKTKAISAHSGTAVANHPTHTHSLNAIAQSTYTKNSLFALDAKTGSAVNGTTTQESNAPMTHSVTQPSAHSDLDVVQPYIVVHFWKRTA